MNCYKILTLLLVSALIISPAAGAVGSGAEEESTLWAEVGEAVRAELGEAVRVGIGISALMLAGAILYDEVTNGVIDDIPNVLSPQEHMEYVLYHESSYIELAMRKIVGIIFDIIQSQ